MEKKKVSKAAFAILFFGLAAFACIGAVASKADSQQKINVLYSGMLNVGQVADLGGLKLRLSDVSVATGSENEHPAILDMLDSSNQTIEQTYVLPGTVYDYRASRSAQPVHIRVFRANPGISLDSKWAELIAYTGEVANEQDCKAYPVLSLNNNEISTSAGKLAEVTASVSGKQGILCGPQNYGLDFTTGYDAGNFVLSAGYPKAGYVFTLWPDETKIFTNVIGAPSTTAAGNYTVQLTAYLDSNHWMQSSKNLKVAVVSSSALQEPAPILLKSGWNMVGAPSQQVDISTYKGNCSILSGPWSYDAEQNQYAYSQKLIPGNGYWIKVAGGCYLGGSLLQPN